MEIQEHPSLDAAHFTLEFSRPLGELESPDWLGDLRRADADAPLAPDDAVRRAVRDLLRRGGFKPTGRSKPASEYLLRAAAEGRLDSINLAVDLGNAVSLHSGLPISVIALERVTRPLRIEIVPAGTRYVFNASGQEIDVGGLLCVCDADGPCANAVKDAQRSKTEHTTRRTLSVIWGTRELPGRTAAAADWYRELATRAGATVSDAV